MQKMVNTKISSAQPQFLAKSFLCVPRFRPFRMLRLIQRHFVDDHHTQYAHPLEHVSADMATVFVGNTRRVLARLVEESRSSSTCIVSHDGQESQAAVFHDGGREALTQSVIIA